MNPAQKIEPVSLDKLLLDEKNPRLAGLLPAGEAPDQNQLLQVIWENMAVDELAASIAADGFYPHEPLLVERQKDGKYVVIEGNRRLATVRLLLDKKLRLTLKATDLPSLSDAESESLRRLPVWKMSRKDAWQIVGFKHVNGPRRWTSYAKAEYIARVREYGHSLSEIAKSIGDNHKTVARLYRALAVIRQAEKMKVFNRDDRWKRHFSFSHLYTGLDYSGIAEFVGLDQESDFAKNAPVPARKKRELGELLIWIYGSEKGEIEPVVKSQNPDIRRLDKALQKQVGIDALRARLPLSEAVAASEGNRAVLRDCLLQAKSALEKALGKSSGCENDRELLRAAENVCDLADDLLRLMNRDNTRRKTETNGRK